MVDDPSANQDLFPTEKAQDKERKRLQMTTANVQRISDSRVGTVQRILVERAARKLLA